MSDVKIVIIPNGPAQINCERAEIVFPDGTTIVKEGRFSICRCGESNKKPFCDGTHNTCGFEG